MTTYPWHQMEVRNQLNTLATLQLGKDPGCSLKRRLSGPLSQLGVSGEEKHLLPLLANEPWTICPILQQFYAVCIIIREKLYCVLVQGVDEILVPVVIVVLGC